MDFLDLGAGAGLERHHATIPHSSWLAVKRLDDAELKGLASVVDGTTRLDENAPDAEHGKQFEAASRSFVPTVEWLGKPRTLCVSAADLLMAVSFISILPFTLGSMAAFSGGLWPQGVGGPLNQRCRTVLPASKVFGLCPGFDWMLHTHYLTRTFRKLWRLKDGSN